MIHLLSAAGNQASGAVVQLNWDTVRESRGDLFVRAADGSVRNIRAAFIRASFFTSWTTNSTGERQIYLVINGGIIAAVRRTATSASEDQTSWGPMWIPPQAQITVATFQTSGVAISPQGPELRVEEIF